MPPKNECAKTRDVNDPYETYKHEMAGWEWRILKKYQTPEQEATNEYARWFCAVKSPHTYNRYDLGDTYVTDIIGTAIKVPNTGERW